MSPIEIKTYRNMALKTARWKWSSKCRC